MPQNRISKIVQVMAWCRQTPHAVNWAKTKIDVIISRHEAKISQYIVCDG